ncbi:MAG: oxidative stress transcriptional regulator OxyR [Gammaproteobacteria bacterium]
MNELRYIVAVAQERHFGRAAERCFVSQPTLSIGVKKLEEELGVTLFERSKTEISLTPAGADIVERAQRILEEVEGLRSAATDRRDQLHGPLRLGVIYTIGPYLLPPLLPELHDLAPQMPLIIAEDFTANLREQLKQGEVDAVVLSLPFDEPGIVTLPLYEEPFVALLPASHPLTRHERLKLEELGEEQLLLLGPGHCFREQVLAAYSSHAPDTRRKTQQNHNVAGTSLETLRLMVASGLGVTVLPSTAAGAERYAERLLAIRRLAEPTPRRTVALAWRVTYPRPKAIEVLRQAICRCPLSGVTVL